MAEITNLDEFRTRRGGKITRVGTGYRARLLWTNKTRAYRIVPTEGGWKLVPYFIPEQRKRP